MGARRVRGYPLIWHRLDWEAFVTPSLLRAVADAAGTNSAPTRSAAAPALARIFEWNGGLPVCGRVPGLRRRTEIGRRLLHEAIQHVSAGRRRVAVPGYAIDRGQRGGVRILRAVSRLSINAASETEIASLPGIRGAVAARIVSARRDRPFRDAGDLSDRVEGLGRSTAKALASRLTFDIPTGEPAAPPPASLEEDLRRLCREQAGGTPLARLTAALELLVARSAAERHPQAARAAIRDFASPDVFDFEAGARVELLAGTAYYERIRSLIGRARTGIDVCMFHIASAGARHPTGRLLDALARARRRGVRVRVLVDRDRRQDPYLSNVINAGAIRRLLRDGVRVRVDAADRLLHSKFLVVDDRYTVIGSHNWTAGSYFGFDDLSLLVTSTAVRRAQRKRFELLWRSGQAPSRRRAP